MLLNLLLGIFWLCVGSGLLYLYFAKQAIGRMTEDSAGLMGGLAILLALYNLIRWWAVRSSRRARARAAQNAPPVRRRVVTDEYHPEFDFKQPEPPATAPEKNGQPPQSGSDTGPKMV